MRKDRKRRPRRRVCVCDPLTCPSRTDRNAYCPKRMPVKPSKEKREKRRAARLGYGSV